ncbi:hypothetical protein SESBI_03916 [Sesbania bispinosa]|nr:hypothetical protein SESBI_03916 [Sesbania bispinosa]
MGAKRSSSSNFFSSLFKGCFSGGSRYHDNREGSGRGRRVFASDEDIGCWVAEPDIDRKASDFIARYYATQVTNSQRQFAS